MLAFALRADGWYLRSDTIWARPNPMPESVTDRPTKAHSYVFLLTKSARYAYDADAIREASGEPIGGNSVGFRSGGMTGNERWTTPREYNPAGRNARSVQTWATQPTPFAHFATFPEALVAWCIKAGTSEHGCCSECGAPWVRIVDRAQRPDIGLTDGGAPNGLSRQARGGGNGEWKKWREANPDTTIGWAPSCTHDAPVTPCVVLDPFVGSGTTCLVARRLGRHAIGIELNADYIAIAAKRLQQLSLLQEATP